MRYDRKTTKEKLSSRLISRREHPDSSPHSSISSPKQNGDVLAPTQSERVRPRSNGMGASDERTQRQEFEKLLEELKAGKKDVSDKIDSGFNKSENSPNQETDEEEELEFEKEYSEHIRRVESIVTNPVTTCEKCESDVYIPQEKTEKMEKNCVYWIKKSRGWSRECRRLKMDLKTLSQEMFQTCQSHFQQLLALQEKLETCMGAKSCARDIGGIGRDRKSWRKVLEQEREKKSRGSRNDVEDIERENEKKSKSYRIDVDDIEREKERRYRSSRNVVEDIDGVDVKMRTASSGRVLVQEKERRSADTSNDLDQSMCKTSTQENPRGKKGKKSLFMRRTSVQRHPKDNDAVGKDGNSGRREVDDDCADIKPRRSLETSTGKKHPNFRNPQGETGTDCTDKKSRIPDTPTGTKLSTSRHPNSDQDASTVRGNRRNKEKVNNLIPKDAGSHDALKRFVDKKLKTEDHHNGLFFKTFDSLEPKPKPRPIYGVRLEPIGHNQGESSKNLSKGTSKINTKVPESDQQNSGRKDKKKSKAMILKDTNDRLKELRKAMLKDKTKGKEFWDDVNGEREVTDYSLLDGKKTKGEDTAKDIRFQDGKKKKGGDKATDVLCRDESETTEIVKGSKKKWKQSRNSTYSKKGHCEENSQDKDSPENNGIDKDSQKTLKQRRNSRVQMEENLQDKGNKDNRGPLMSGSQGPKPLTTDEAVSGDSENPINNPLRRARIYSSRIRRSFGKNSKGKDYAKSSSISGGSKLVTDSLKMLDKTPEVSKIGKDTEHNKGSSFPEGAKLVKDTPKVSEVQKQSRKYRRELSDEIEVGFNVDDTARQITTVVLKDMADKITKDISTTKEMNGKSLDVIRGKSKEMSEKNTTDSVKPQNGEHLELANRISKDIKTTEGGNCKKSRSSKSPDRDNHLECPDKESSRLAHGKGTGTKITKEKGDVNKSKVENGLEKTCSNEIAKAQQLETEFETPKVKHRVQSSAPTRSSEESLKLVVSEQSSLKTRSGNRIKKKDTILEYKKTGVNASKRPLIRKRWSYF